jgi:hypothetical protein
MKVVLLTTVCCVLMMGGCAFLDNMAGIDPETGEVAGPSVAERVAPIAPLGGAWGTLGAGALGLLTTLYTNLRRKKYKSAALTGVKSVEEVIKMLDSEEGVSRDQIIAALKRLQEKDGTRDTIKELIPKS